MKFLKALSSSLSHNVMLVLSISFALQIESCFLTSMQLGILLDLEASPLPAQKGLVEVLEPLSDQDMLV